MTVAIGASHGKADQMHYAMARQDYERLFPDDVLEGEYPKNSNAAIVELRSRGLDADLSRVNYMISRGDVEKPFGRGRNLRWHRENLDQAAEVLDGEGRYTRQAAPWAGLHVLFAQQRDAVREARDLWPEVDTDFLKTVIVPYGWRGPVVVAKSEYDRSPYNLVSYEFDQELLERLAALKGPQRQAARNCLAAFRARSEPPIEEEPSTVKPAKRRSKAKARTTRAKTKSTKATTRGTTRQKRGTAKRARRKT